MLTSRLVLLAAGSFGTCVFLLMCKVEVSACYHLDEPKVSFVLTRCERISALIVSAGNNDDWQPLILELAANLRDANEIEELKLCLRKMVDKYGRIDHIDNLRMMGNGAQVNLGRVDNIWGLIVRRVASLTAPDPSSTRHASPRDSG
jgi:hypothetical protein